MNINITLYVTLLYQNYYFPDFPYDIKLSNLNNVNNMYHNIQQYDNIDYNNITIIIILSLLSLLLRMQLQKLKKRAFKINKRYQIQKLRYHSLNVIIPPTPLLTNQQITKHMIDSDACMHDNNNQQLIQQQFISQLPNNKKIDVNKMYMHFIMQITGNEQYEDKQMSIEKDNNNNRDKDKSKQKYISHDVAIKRHQKYIQKCTNCMIKIYQQADKKHEIVKYKVAKLDKQIEKLYYDCHQYYIKLMQLRNQTESQLLLLQQKEKEKQQLNQQNGQNGQSGKNMINSFTKIPSQLQIALNKNIQRIKQRITQKEEQSKKLSDMSINLKQQKIQFLKQLLRNGYRQVDGIKWILIKLAKNDSNLSKTDLYHILDDITKQCLMKQYQCIKTQLHKQSTSKLPSLRHSFNPKAQIPQLQQNPSMPSLSYTRFIDIPNTDKSRAIYKNAQNYIIDWVRKQKWKVRSLSLKSKSTQHTQRSKDWKDDEVKRLKDTYPKQQYQSIMKYIFGNTKYYTIKQSLALHNQKIRKTSKYIANQQNGQKFSQASANPQHHSKNLSRNNTDNSQQNIRSYAKRGKQSEKVRKDHQV